MTLSKTRTYSPSRGETHQQADCGDPKPTCAWQASLKVDRGGSRSGRMAPWGTCEGTAETGDEEWEVQASWQASCRAPGGVRVPGPPTPPRPHSAQELSL